MQKFYERLALVYVATATLCLALMAALLLGHGVWSVVTTFGSEGQVDAVLDSIGLLIIGFAVIETAKFIAEEEILRKRELRSAMESRLSLTKFITIIVIAASLEALVMVFKTSRSSISDAIYPAVLFAAAMSALVALGAYQWLSSRIEAPSDLEKQDAAKGAREKRVSK